MTTQQTQQRVPGLGEIRAAGARIAPHINRTPLFTSRTLDLELDAEVVFKCENFQKIGAFKARGAVNAVLCLDQAAASKGVATHSSGNHAAALAYAASIRRVPCTVVMPETSNPIKLEAVRGYGAEIVLCRQGERVTTCDRVLEETGATFIHPFENPEVIAGQGTAALELLDERPDLDIMVAPVGGGGLLAGTVIAVRTLRPGAVVIGAEPQAVDDAYRSLETGVRQPGVTDPKTIADGLLTGLGQINFQILSDGGVRIVTVTEDAIREAALFHLQRMKLVVEPSGAVGLAALRALGEEIEGRRVGVIISGGNTDFTWL